MENTILVLTIVYGAFFCFAGIMHFLKPKLFNRFIPNVFPKKLVNYVVGFIEFTLGLGVFFSQTTQIAALGIIILLILLLPIHIWDATKVKPAIGTKKIALARIPFQFVLIYGVYLIYIHS